jgi:hypothetical protein
MAALKFRILLDTEKENEVFRDILINEDDNFESLYNAIVSAFNFQGDQMASFYISNDDWDKGHEISLMDMNYGDESINEVATVMSDANLRDFMEKEDQKVILVYDFLRMWIFLIELVERQEENVSVPMVALSIGMAPPEDSRIIADEEDDALFASSDFDEEEDNEFDFEDGYDDEDLSEYSEYDY